MTETMQEPAPTGLARVLAAAIQHSERWGMVWFGLIFWGSVLNALGGEVWPDADSLVVALAAAAIGLAAGISAKARGRWI